MKDPTLMAVEAAVHWDEHCEKLNTLRIPATKGKTYRAVETRVVRDGQLAEGEVAGGGKEGYGSQD
jgi:hypothetical protein